MRAALAACLLLSFTVPVAAQDTKPNTLTAQEVAQGWILLFDGGTTFGWRASENVDHLKPALSVKNDSLSITSPILANPKEVERVEVQCTTKWPGYEITGEYRMLGKVGFVSPTVDDGKMTVSQGFQLEQTQGESWKPMSLSWKPGQAGVRLRDKENPKAPRVEPNQPAIFGLTFRLPAGVESELQLRNLKLRPVGLEPLFNGKDLEGWSINKSDPKRMASQWAVTKEGELSLKTGPGDLVSNREFDNFILQAECKTLGVGLNSGIFFRCIPGQYQNGYEAQIHNLYKDNDRTKPVDFGTGAIYRRVPARRVVGNDNEWFTMTIAAEGNHLATWVNGYQTVDWTDTRPADENPRKGYRSAKGPISLQGHDPTTDLLFRNIRVAELSNEKK